MLAASYLRRLLSSSKDTLTSHKLCHAVGFGGSDGECCGFLVGDGAAEEDRVSLALRRGDDAAFDTDATGCFAKSGGCTRASLTGELCAGWSFLLGEASLAAVAVALFFDGERLDHEDFGGEADVPKMPRNGAFDGELALAAFNASWARDVVGVALV